MENDQIIAENEQKNQVEEVVLLNPQTPNNKDIIWKTIKKLSSRWFIDAFTGMAFGLFATLIAGTIFCTIATLFNKDTRIFYVINTIGTVAKTLMGAGIGIGIAYKLKAKPLVIFTGVVSGLIGAFSNLIVKGTFTATSLAVANNPIALGAPGNPIGAYVVALICIELASLYAGKTKFDIILIPIGMMIISCISIYVAWPFIYIIDKLGILIAKATEITPFFMGIIVAVVVGILLTMPTSSAAIWVAVSSTVISQGGVNAQSMLLAGGAAVVGCCCQMVGFAVMSFKENGFSGLISQGLGTSMLQIPNIMKNPWTFVPPIVASAICGPLSTCAFKLKCGVSGGGMGTSGLVGVIDTFTQSGSSFKVWIGVILLEFILPAIISFGVCYLLRKLGKIKENDLLLPIE